MSAKRKLTKEQRMDWSSLHISEWNVLTFQSYFSDMNIKNFEVTEYTPMRNWSFEQGVLRKALDAHGPEVLRAAFDECFRTHRVSRQYPILTAGFACAYLINGIIPRIKAEMADRERRESEKATEGTADYSELAAWL